MNVSPPLTLELESVALPKRPSKRMLPSSAPPALLFPLVPPTVAYSIVKLVTSMPRTPKFWFVPLMVRRRRVMFETLFR